MRRLTLPAVLAAVLLLPGAASAARGVTVKVPKGITADRIFSLTAEGDTGPGDQAGGGFIVAIRVLKGKAACPATESTSSRFGALGISENIWAPGAFRTGTQTFVSKAGSYRICSYLSGNDDALNYELVGTKTFTAKALPRHAKLQLDQKKPKAGKYTATAAHILGGGPTSSLTFTIQGGKVVSAAATGVPNTSCFSDFSTQTPVLDSFNGTVPTSSSGNPVIGISIASSWVGAAPSGQVRLEGDAVSSKEIRGQASVTSADGSCRGGFAFTATR